jgi:hypothetical protein
VAQHISGAGWITITCEFIMIMLGSFVVLSNKTSVEVGLFGMVIAMSGGLLFRKDFNKFRTQAFVSYKSLFKEELQFFSLNNEFLQFILFLEASHDQDLLTKKSLKSAINLSKSEMTVNSLSHISSNPLFTIFASAMAASIVFLFWQSSKEFEAFGLLFTIPTTFMVILWITIKAINHNALYKVNKFCHWANCLTKEDIERFKSSQS